MRRWEWKRRISYSVGPWACRRV